MSSNRTGIDLQNPPPRRVPGPLIDCHAHILSPRDAALFIEAARTYKVDRVFAISETEVVEPLKKRYGSYFEFYYRVPFDEKDTRRKFKKLSMERIDEAAEKGFIALKFWFKPQFTYENKISFDDPRMFPIFERAEAHGLPCLTHIADPDTWYEHVYTNRKKYGTKKKCYTQFTNAFRDFPKVTFIGAHLAGDCENLNHLQDLLDEFPNLVMDCSATKWVVRELSKKPEEAREFFIRNSDRILFGTDLVTFPEIREFDRYASRYWAHQMMWESDLRGESPIDDPDSDGPPRLNGLHLPEDVLERMYWRNAVRVFRIRKPRVRTSVPQAPQYATQPNS